VIVRRGEKCHQNAEMLDAQPVTSSPSSTPPRLRLYLLLGALTAFPPLSIDMYLPSFPALQLYFHAGVGAVQRTLAVFFIGLSLGQLVFGPLSDRYGRRGPLLFGIVLYVGAALTALFAPDIGVLTVARFFQALGGCAAVVIARAMVRDLFHERESARVFSLLMLVMGLAPMLAPMLGGQLLAFAGWQGIFAALAGFACLCLLAVLFGLRESLPVERRARNGLGGVFTVYANLLRDRGFIGHALAGAFNSGALFAYITGSPFVFMQLHGVSPGLFGALFGVNALGLIVASQVNRALLKRFSDRLILKIALRVTAAAAISLGVFAWFDIGGLVALMIPLFICLSSMGFVMPNATAAAMAQSGRNAGSAAALLGALQFSIAALAGASVSALQSGTAFPMCGIILSGSIAAFLTHAILVENRPRPIFSLAARPDGE
jgi:DHA1 family bicyclomycin/chloramphenicol resistance-like MFS transporter